MPPGFSRKWLSTAKVFLNHLLQPSEASQECIYPYAGSWGNRPEQISSLQPELHGPESTGCEKDDLNLKEMTPEELDRAWDLWFDLAQATNDFDPPYTHGVFVLCELEREPPSPDEAQADP